MRRKVALALTFILCFVCFFALSETSFSADCNVTPKSIRKNEPPDIISIGDGQLPGQRFFVYITKGRFSEIKFGGLRGLLPVNGTIVLSGLQSNQAFRDMTSNTGYIGIRVERFMGFTPQFCTSSIEVTGAPFSCQNVSTSKGHYLPGETINVSGTTVNADNYPNPQVYLILKGPDGSEEARKLVNVENDSFSGQFVVEMGVKGLWQVLVYQGLAGRLSDRLCDSNYFYVYRGDVPSITITPGVGGEPADPCAFLIEKQPPNEDEYEKCKKCFGWYEEPEGEYNWISAKAWTAVGCIPTAPEEFIKWLLPVVISIAGGIAFLLILLGSFTVLTSAGNPDKLNEGKDIIVSAIVGLLVILFSVVLLKIIGVDILGLPGFEA